MGRSLHSRLRLRSRMWRRKESGKLQFTLSFAPERRGEKAFVLIKKIYFTLWHYTERGKLSTLILAGMRLMETTFHRHCDAVLLFTISFAFDTLELMGVGLCSCRVNIFELNEYFMDTQMLIIVYLFMTYASSQHTLILHLNSLLNTQHKTKMLFCFINNSLVWLMIGFIWISLQRNHRDGRNRSQSCSLSIFCSEMADQ